MKSNSNFVYLKKTLYKNLKRVRKKEETETQKENEKRAILEWKNPLTETIFRKSNRVCNTNFSGEPIGD